MFCPQCRALMKPQEGMLVCPRCGQSKEGKEKDNIKVMKKAEDREIIVMDKDEHLLPKTSDCECPKCGNREAYWIIRQTRAADEPETRIYTCTKCSHTWREY